MLNSTVCESDAMSTKVTAALNLAYQIQQVVPIPIGIWKLNRFV